MSNDELVIYWLKLSEDIAEELDLVTSLNINTRYPDDKFFFIKNVLMSSQTGKSQL
ncbi:MAG TPA: hypothetical protein PLK65_02025 [Candidatus Cloacimonas sp.]|jgi:hypothetical protein|nr:hypothetical protein [Candidatus Cloacimonas sp.]HNS85099.1 hypothetical protein [Candidatus Cloacimonas sp.]HPA24786.1 hypothetical protein [Candidatus Cloacimonas sp.]HPX09946.1 hypothetical protein [Candidatus Cloacimonas sp.]HQP32975.1 hypothetical protein [Candidatus Cloacimonas sp.]